MSKGDGLPFKAKDLVEVVRNYSFKIQEFPHNYVIGDVAGLSGLIDDVHKNIYIDSAGSTEEQRITIIHEALHAHSFIHGLGWNEETIDKESHKLFKSWYGYKYEPGIVK